MKCKKAGKRFFSVLLTAGMLFGTLSVPAFADGGQNISFSDVKDTDWFYDSVQYVCENGLMNGTGDAVFSPDGTTTRGMIVTILYRMENSPAADSDVTFTDVSAGQYYADAVAWASENDIVNGYGSGQFGPDDPITREQMASVLYRYAQLKGYDIAAEGNISSFSDVENVSAYAVNPMRWAAGNRLISGIGDNMLAPGEMSTRAQTAAILTRFCENIVPEEPFEPVRPSGSVAYENRDLGFRIEFPNNWENRYRVEMTTDGSSGILVKTEWGGILCFIYREDAEKWKEEAKGDAIPVEYRVLGENDEYIYTLYFASDAQHDPEDEEQTRIYREMREDLYRIGFEILPQNGDSEKTITLAEIGCDEDDLYEAARPVIDGYEEYYDVSATALEGITVTETEDGVFSADYFLHMELSQKDAGNGSDADAVDEVNIALRTQFDREGNFLKQLYETFGGYTDDISVILPDPEGGEE